jgi:murein DD-endopeptidase MepM/ murein hydrolase activator NlpD
VFGFFPRKSRRRTIAGLALCGLLASAVGVPLAAADDLKHKKHKVTKHIKQTAQDLDESSKQLQLATAALLQSQKDLAAARAYLSKTQSELTAARILDAQMQAKLVAAEHRLAVARLELATGLKNVAEQNLLVRQIVVENYQNGGTDLMGLTTVLNSHDPSQLTGELNSVQTVMDKESSVLDRLQATKVLLTVRQREVNLAKIAVAAQRKAAAENLVRKQALEAQAQQAAQQVSTMVSLRAQARSAALKAKNSDLKQLKKLQSERDRIENLIRQQASHGAGYTGPVTGNGWLSWPAPGPVTSPFGWRIHPIYGYRSLHDGIDIGAGCGVPLKAAQTGVVLSEYYQTAWGNRLIIDHGVKYGVGVATIYNHMSGYAVSTGEHVKKGQTIGYVGTTGWSTGCHLHFTVLENGVAVDPMKWL